MRTNSVETVIRAYLDSRDLVLAAKSTTTNPDQSKAIRELAETLADDDDFEDLPTKEMSPERLAHMCAACREVE